MSNPTTQINRNSRAAVVLIACLAIGYSARTPAKGQNEVVLHSFGDGSVPDDGATPFAGLIQGLDGDYYGTTSAGGSAGMGTVFKISPSGLETILHNFDDISLLTAGENPYGTLVQATDGTFFGTTADGSVSLGTVFSMTPTGLETVLHTFGENDGADPVGKLILGSDGNYYGTTYAGGLNNNEEGIVFKLAPSGHETILHIFGDGSVPNDGKGPYAGLVQGPDGSFYGTTWFGGASAATADPSHFGYGTVFKITPTGQETVLHSFSDGTVLNDGIYPSAPLVLGPDGNFYGTTSAGGSTAVRGTDQTGAGTLFKITPSGQETVLHSFFVNQTDGAGPAAGLLLGDDGNFYGTTEYGGDTTTPRGGTIFQLTPSGKVTILHTFQNDPDGSEPYAGLVEGSDMRMYGTTLIGGTAGEGIVFAFIAPPTITGGTPLIGPIGTSVAIKGFYLGEATVKFNGILATVLSDTPEEVIAVAPPGAGTGPITVTTPGGTATTTSNFTVTPGIAAPIITEVSPLSGPVGTHVTITGANLAFATVAFNGALAAVTSDSATQIVVPVPVGATSGPISVTTPGGTTTSTAKFRVIPPAAISGIGLAKTIAGGRVVVSAVHVSEPVPSATTVDLFSSSRVATLPATVTIPANATSAPFTLTTVAVSVDTPVTISASFNASGPPAFTDDITVVTLALYSFLVSPGVVTGPTTTYGLIQLNGPAPTGGLSVTVATTNSAALVPASVTIPAGSSSGLVPIKTKPVGTTTSGTVTVTYKGATLSSPLTVAAPAPAFIKVSPSTTIQAGKSAIGTVALTGPPTAATTVYLFSSNAAASVPASAVVAAGATLATFPITTAAVSSKTPATIRASANASGTPSVSVPVTVTVP